MVTTYLHLLSTNGSRRWKQPSRCLVVPFRPWRWFYHHRRTTPFQQKLWPGHFYFVQFPLNQVIPIMKDSIWSSHISYAYKEFHVRSFKIWFRCFPMLENFGCASWNLLFNKLGAPTSKHINKTKSTLYNDGNQSNYLRCRWQVLFSNMK